MRLGRYPYRSLYEEETFDDFDYTDDYADDDFEDDYVQYDTSGMIEQLKKISSNLGISGKPSTNDYNKFIYSISSKTKVIVEFGDEITELYVTVKNSKTDREVKIDCFDDTTELSNLCDDLTTAIMLIKEVSSKLM